jgi:radical SAM superfamily enzyme YgiQ (UPF0313 family)
MPQIKVLLINPPLEPPRGIQLTFGRHLGLAYIASALRQRGHQVEIIDAILEKLEIDELIDRIAGSGAALIGFTLYQGAVGSFLDIMSRLQQIGIDVHITAGGIFPTIAADELLMACSRLDSVVSGEGEYTLCDLADAISLSKDWTSIDGLSVNLNGEVFHNKERPLIHDLDNLPFPATDSVRFMLEQFGIRTASVISSRGCYGKCTFCHTPTYYRRFEGSVWRTRSSRNVADEVEELVRNYGINYIEFCDDAFVGPGLKEKAVLRSCQEIKKRNIEIKFSVLARVNDVDRALFAELKEAGLDLVFLGVESINQGTLDNYNKHIASEQIYKAISVLDDLGIGYNAGYILFDPYVTVDYLKNSIGFWRELKTRPYNRTVGFGDRLFILKDTPIEEKIRDTGLLFPDDLCNGYEHNYNFLHLEVQEIFDAYYEVMERLYTI